MAYSNLKTFTEPFSHFINLRDNRYRFLDLTDPRTTTSVRTTSTSVPALSSHQVSAVTNKVNRLLTLSRVFSLKSSTFLQQDTSRPRTGPGPPHTGGIHLTYRSAKIPCAGTVGSPDSLPSRTPVDSGSYQQVQPGGVTLDGTLEMVRQSHQ